MATTSMGAEGGTSVLDRMIRPEIPSLSPEAARSILELSFAENDRARVTSLLERNQSAGLTPAERDELEEYLRLDAFLSVLQSKARLSLKRAGSGPGTG